MLKQKRMVHKQNTIDYSLCKTLKTGKDGLCNICLKELCFAALGAVVYTGIT